MVELKITKVLLEELALATEKILQQYKLANSDLIRSVEYKWTGDWFELIANDYFMNVAFGRQRRARKVPVEDLIKWMKKKGIAPKNGDYNSAAFNIQRAIYLNGIKARPYVNPIIETDLDIISEDFAYELSEDIALEIATDIEKLNN